MRAFIRENTVRAQTKTNVRDQRDYKDKSTESLSDQLKEEDPRRQRSPGQFPTLA